MSNALINFYHHLEEPIVIYDKKQDILYHNLSFKKIFGEFNNTKGFDYLSKLSYKFSYQMCFLKSEDLRTYNPIIAAINKEINFVIEEALSKNIIRKNRATYYFGTDVIGNGIEDVIAYLKDKKNQEIYLSIMSEIKSK